MDICSRLTSCALSHLSSHTAFFTHISPSSSVVAALLSSILPLFLVFYSCPLLSLGSCDISLTGIIASSPMQYKCPPLSLFPSLALSLSHFLFFLLLSHLHRKRERRNLMSHQPPANSQGWHACLCRTDCRLLFIWGIDWAFDPPHSSFSLFPPQQLPSCFCPKRL